MKIESLTLVPIPKSPVTGAVVRASLALRDESSAVQIRIEADLSEGTNLPMGQLMAKVCEQGILTLQKLKVAGSSTP